MSTPRRILIASIVALIATMTSGCASSPSMRLAAGGQATLEGSIVSVDTQPWAYDGHAVVVIETTAHGQVRVNLPARWNLCKAAPVQVETLGVGARARAIGTVGEDGDVTVCERETHALVRLD